MRYDRVDSFPFDFEPNGFPFGSILMGFRVRNTLTLPNYVSNSDKNKKKTWIGCPERLVPVGVMAAQFRAPLKPLGIIYCCNVRWVSGGPQ